MRHGNRLDFKDPHWPLTAERPYDPPLSPDGQAQAHDLGKRLANESVRHIFSSPFLRAIETACGIAEHLNLPVQVENGLCELLRPDWFPTKPELLSRSALSARYSRLDATYSSFVKPVYPEAEEQMRVRTARTIHHLLSHFEGDLLLVAHGASIIGFAHALVKGEPPVSTLLACLVQVSQRNGDWVLLRNGSDTSHLTIPDSSTRLA